MYSVLRTYIPSTHNLKIRPPDIHGIPHSAESAETVGLCPVMNDVCLYRCMDGCMNGCMYYVHTR